MAAVDLRNCYLGFISVTLFSLNDHYLRSLESSSQLPVKKTSQTQLTELGAATERERESVTTELEEEKFLN